MTMAAVGRCVAVIVCLASNAWSAQPQPQLVPAPPLERWLEGTSTDIRVQQSTAVVLFLDPGFYYQVEASTPAMERLVVANRLRSYPVDNYACRAAFEPPAPPPVTVAWWTPQALKSRQCYQGDVKGNIVYVVFVAGASTAYIYVQNT